jgi:hypothetical protein
LGANGTPDKLIEEGLKQPNQIKVSFKKGTKEITGHVVPNQAQFDVEYVLAYTLPSFKSKILTRLLDLQKDNGPLLFSLLGQCFQDVGLTEWTSVVAKQCPDNADCMKANFNECIMDYLEVPQLWQPADLLALYGQKAHSHANERVHAASSAASQLPQE